MEDIPHSVLFAALAVLLACSAFFSMTETAMMSSNRHRLRHLAGQGDRGARLAIDLLGQTDKLRGVSLLGNNLVNTAAATLASVITIQLFGENELALGAGTLLLTFLILVFSEITPKIIGATHADRLARLLAFAIWPLLRIAYPVVWFVNLFATGLLRLFRLQQRPDGDSERLSPDELRSLVLESSHFIPQQHRSILLNLFDLESVTVADIMTPRSEIEGIDLSDSIDVLREQIASSYHSRLVVYEGDPGNVVGVLHQRRLIHDAFAGEFTHERLRELLSEPYFIPAATPIYAQMQFFRDNRRRMGLVVDEYGEIQGLVSMEDTVEEIIGKFTTSLPGTTAGFEWNADGVVLVDGMASLRDLNRRLGLELPLNGPRTLNGLIIEHLRDIPEVDVGIQVAGVAMEIVQTHDRKVKMVRLHRPKLE